jgi:primosomal protein N' (replication factor Y)
LYWKEWCIVYAEIVVNLPVEGTFHYHIPAEFAGRLRPGHLVEVNFGAQKAQGVVLDFSLRAPVQSTKPILSLIDREPVITEQQLELAQWLSERYRTALSYCIQIFIPPGLSKRGDMLYIPVIDPELVEAASETQTRLLSLLARRGPLRGRQIARLFSRQDWQKAAAQLTERGLLLREPILDPPSVNIKTVQVAELAVVPEQVEAVIARHFDVKHTPTKQRPAAQRRTDILRLLAHERLPIALREVYTLVPGSKIADLQALAEDDLVLLRQQEVWRDPLEGITFIPDQPPHLTSDQARVWDDVFEALKVAESHLPFLLHGVTGSGKTEIYLRAVDQVLAQDRSAIILVPEIALTAQTIRRFGARFPGRVGIIHSQLSDGERYDTWRRARSGQCDVIIGPRSALFTPLKNLGLIVIDECHDDSYKQSLPEGAPIPPPYYHTIPTAIEQAKLHNAVMLMGSATPDVAMYAQATRPGSPTSGAYTLLELPARIMGHRRAIEVQALHYHVEQTRYIHRDAEPEEAVMIELPPVQVIDMRQELRAGNRSVFSRALASALEATLDRGEQAILFLNRRGAATYVFCRSCGYTLTCPQCGIPMTWHSTGGDSGILVCHHCNRRDKHPQKCPSCQSDQIRYFGGGTERIEQEVMKRFPGAGIVRWDRDTTGGKDSHDALLQRFVNRQANILIGTQMVAKGLDLPLVTLVGVISADTALYLPDYRSGERTFQLLTQVAGRAGRGLLGGEVILQTYAPDHYAVRAAAEHDFHTFYAQELNYRRQLGYPPFSRLVRLLIRAETSEAAQRRSTDIRNTIAQRIAEQHLHSTEIIGPAPAFYPRRDNMYRWHVIVRGPNPVSVLEGFSSSPSLHIDIDPVSLL